MSTSQTLGQPMLSFPSVLQVISEKQPLQKSQCTHLPNSNTLNREGISHNTIIVYIIFHMIHINTHKIFFFRLLNWVYVNAFLPKFGIIGFGYGETVGSKGSKAGAGSAEGGKESNRKK